VAADPDLCIVFGGQNDSANSKASIQAAAESLFATLKASLPRTVFVVVGCWMTSEAIASTVRDCDDAIRAACVTADLPFISLQDPSGVRDTTTAWATATAYLVGDRVSSSNNVWVCHTSHTSSGSLDTTKFHPASFITGTGKVGTTTGRGNADIFITNDGIHPSLVGHSELAAHLAAKVVDRLRTLVAAD
jgi:lysophospholipase L1-like esterase